MALTGIPRRSVTVGQGMSQVQSSARQASEKVSKPASSSKLSSEKSKERFRRKDSRSSSMMDLSHVPSSAVQPETGMTFTDLFLQDVVNAAAALVEGTDADTVSVVRPFIPLPQAILAQIAQLHHSHSKHHMNEVIEQKKVNLRLEMTLQEYWKSFARWPAWPLLRENQSRLAAFREKFHEGLHFDTLIHHCGEHLKCAAFVVVCTEKVGIRSSPTHAQEKQTGEVLLPGQMVIVDNVLIFDKVKYLKLRQGGWVFERKGNVQCLAYMTEVEIGQWWYSVVSFEYAEVRIAPSFKERARSGFVLAPGEVCVIALRCVVNGREWLVLADGRGWIFEMRPPCPDKLRGTAVDHEFDEVVLAECNDDKLELEKEDADITQSGVELGMWEYEALDEVLAVGSSTSGWLLAKGDKVFVDMRVPANGQKVKEASSATGSHPIATRIWLRLVDGRGWIPKTGVTGAPLVRFVRMGNPTAAQISRNQKMEGGDLGWQTGVA